MGRKKNECGFSIPWISSPSTESSKQKQKQKAKSDRPPFRPPGIASAPPQPKMKELEPSNSTAKAEPLTTTTTYVEKKMMFGASNEDIKAVTPPSIRKKINVSTIPLSTEEEDQEKQVSTLASAEDKTVSVVTLAGDNRGVTMQVAGSHSSKEKKDDETGKAYVNSNIQSINNSIMSNGSISGRDPGVRVVLPQPQQQAEKKNNEDISIKRAERLPYQPVVRRRCLRGLFLEPSDSEADHKPRRHGCKFSCGGDASKDHNKDIAVPK